MDEWFVLLDPMGAMVTEIRDWLDGVDLTDKVRGFEPAPPIYHPQTKQMISAGDARQPGSYIRFVVLNMLSSTPDPRLPIQRSLVGAKCYGTTPHDAAVLYGQLVQAVHDVGPRVKGNGLGIYMSKVVAGGTAQKDPDSQQPYVTATISLIATAQAVT